MTVERIVRFVIRNFPGMFMIGLTVSLAHAFPDRAWLLVVSAWVLSAIDDLWTSAVDREWPTPKRAHR